MFKMISICLLFLFMSSVQSQIDAILQDFDGVAAKLLAYGDKYNKFPVDKVEANNLCDRYNQLAPNVSYLIHPIFNQYGITQINQFTANTVCKLYKDNPTEMTLFAAEVNSKLDLMDDLYRKMNNLGSYTTEGRIGHDYCNNFSLMACYFRIWLGELNDLLTEASKIINNKIFGFYLDFITRFEYLADCSWSKVPSASNIKYRSINLNFALGTLNCFTGINL